MVHRKDKAGVIVGVELAKSSVCCQVETAVLTTSTSASPARLFLSTVICSALLLDCVVLDPK